jgi:rhodanese-related sulfurtransferase
MKKKFLLVVIPVVLICLGFVLTSQSESDSKHFTAVSAKQAANLIDKHNGDSEFVILDIRTPGEFKSGHLAESVLIDFYSQTFAENLSRLDKEKTYLIYCRSGNRSSKSLEIFKKLKFQKVYHMESGIRAWQSEGFSVVK